MIFNFVSQFLMCETLRPSSCIWDKDQDQAQKNVILGSSSDPRIKIKDQDQILGSGSRREIRIKIDPDLNLIQDQLYIVKRDLDILQDQGADPDR